MRRSRAALAALLTTLSLASCTPLYVPPVPSGTLTAPASWRVAGDAEFQVLGAASATGLRVRLRFAEVPAPAWVAVQWFGPAGGERASASTWVTPDDVGRWIAWDLPSEVVLAPGSWRAVVSVGERLLRQLDAVVPAAHAP
ncbi:MAG: hypothetical protein P1P87_15240 [Trueperaceae bacterium]|nr:hypothetical protein [Trueperaceae bacterium]